MSKVAIVEVDKCSGDPDCIIVFDSKEEAQKYESEHYKDDLVSIFIVPIRKKNINEDS